MEPDSHIKVPDLGYWTALAAFVAWLLGTVGGWISKYGMDVWERRRKRLIEEKFDIARLDLMEDEQLKDGFKILLKKQDRRISDLEKRADHYQDAHGRCMEENAKIETELHYFKTRLEEAVRRIEGYRQELRRYQGDPRPSPPPILLPPEEEENGSGSSDPSV